MPLYKTNTEAIVSLTSLKNVTILDFPCSEMARCVTDACSLLSLITKRKKTLTSYKLLIKALHKPDESGCR